MAQYHEAGPRRGGTVTSSQHRRECHTEPNREEPVVVIIAPNKDAPTTSAGWGGGTSWHDASTTTTHLGVVTYYPRAAINGQDAHLMVGVLLASFPETVLHHAHDIQARQAAIE